MMLTTSLIEEALPLRLPAALGFTPEQFALVCAENREAVLELSADGRVIPMTPTGGETGARSGELFFQLKLYANCTAAWKAFDSSTGFSLADGSVLSPNASLVGLERWMALTPQQRRGFAPLCPDLVVELASPSDEGPRGVAALRRKMADYQRNGARLGWLLLPEERAVEVWPAAGDPERLEDPAVLMAPPEFRGLSLQLAEIWST